MSGKPQFDEHAVIAAAVDVFWRHGYVAASINNLTEATGLSRSSIYQRFGDKDGLFLEALEAYKARGLKRMTAIQGDTERERLVALLRAFTPKQLGADRPVGCLIARSYTETAELSPAVRSAVLAAATELREVFMGILNQAIKNRELPNDTDVEAMGWYYFGIQQTIVKFPAIGADQNTLDRMIDVAMANWPG